MKPKLAGRSAMPAFVALLTANLAAPVLAQSASPAQALLDDKFVVNLGAFVVNTDLSGNLNGRSTNNPEVDFDRDFGRDNDATRIRADMLWRITPTQHVRFMYFDNTRKASRVIDRDIKWGDFTFQVGGNVESEQKLRITELAYEYAFVRQPGLEVAGSAGIHYLESRVKLSGAATVTDANGVVSPVTFSTKSSSLPAPLPVFGLRAGWVVAPQWLVDAQGQFFKIKVNEIDGRLTDLRLGATWMFSRNFGAGLGWNRFTTTVDSTKSSFDGSLKVGYSGLQVYLTGSF